jgi:hypothetical protein
MIKLTCHSCGGKLEITPDIERFACGHCGNEWIVNRTGGIVSLKAVEEHLSKVQEHTKETAEHTKETAEHSKIIADDIKLKKINERINALTFEANRIDKNPQKKNNNRYIPLAYGIWLSLISLVIAIVCNLIGHTNIIFIPLIFIFPVISLFICMFFSDTIPDEQQLQVNLNRVKDIA